MRASQLPGGDVRLDGRRVLLVLATSTGGVGVHVRSLARGLRERGAVVTVAAPAATQEVFGFAGHVPLEVGGAPHPARDAAALARLRRLAGECDVVHAHGLRAGALAVLAAGDVPVVVSWHNVVEGRLGSVLEKVAARRAAVTLAASSDLVARARAAGGADVRLAPVAPPPPAPTGSDPGLGRPLVLAVGRLHPQKGYDVLLRALPLLGDAVVAVAGDGPLAAALREQAPQVRWLGRRDDVADLYAAADVVVLPSAWEARSLTAQEALLAGRPLVASAVGGLPALLGDGAVLVPPGDAEALGRAVRRLLDDPAAAAALAERGRAVAARWPDEADAVAQAAALYADADRVRRWLLAALVAVLTLLPAVPAAAQVPVGADVRGAQVLVIGVPGLRWSDVEPATMPALHALAGRSAVGVLSVKALPAVSCPADGWLTLGAGSRAQAFDVACGELSADRDAVRERNLATRDAADPDALATALRDADGCLSARGAGAELAGGAPLTEPAGANQGGSAARGCPLLLLDATVVEADGAERATGAAVADVLVAAVDAARDPGSTLLVVGLSQAPTDSAPGLQVALAAGPTFSEGALRSASTRRTPYVQLVDVAPTVLDLLGVAPPPEMTGQPWQVVDDEVSPAALADLSLRAAEADRAVVPFSAGLVAALMLGLAVALVVGSWRLVELTGLGAVGAITGAFLSVLVPWWRAPQPLLALVGVALVVAAGAVVLARRARGVVGPATAVCAGLAGLLVADLLTGARLQVDTPFGYSPLVAGRFAGIGNVGFGVYAAAVLLALAGLTHGRRPRAAGAVVAGGGLLAVAVLGAPPFGSDVGGVLALFPAVVLLALLRSGSAVTAARVAFAGAGGVLVVGAFALLDVRRAPADRTHLGRFVEQVADGTAGTVLRRKADAVLDLLLANAVTALLPLVVAAAVLLVVRPPSALRRAFVAAPAWRHGLLALGAASAVGFAANDSGPAVPALAILVAVPATLAVVARRAQGGADDR